MALKPVYCTDRPVAPLTLISGPLLRRGTTIVAAGTPAAGGTTTTSSWVPSPGWLARKVSGMICVGSRLPLYVVATGTPPANVSCSE